MSYGVNKRVLSYSFNNVNSCYVYENEIKPSSSSSLQPTSYIPHNSTNQCK